MSRRGAYTELLRSNPSFRRLWIAQLISLGGDWFNVVALTGLLLHLTGSSFYGGARRPPRPIPPAPVSPGPPGGGRPARPPRPLPRAPPVAGPPAPGDRARRPPGSALPAAGRPTAQ